MQSDKTHESFKLQNLQAQSRPWQYLQAPENEGNSQAERSEIATGHRLSTLDEEETFLSETRHHSEDETPLLTKSNSKKRARIKKSLPSSLSSSSSADLSNILPQDVREKDRRQILVGRGSVGKYPINAVSNSKYTPWSFLPITLYNEFALFFNLYFLLVALSQIIRPLRVGYLSTYIAPLVFVLSISLGKEAVDDLKRRRRDAEANKEPYAVLNPPHRHKHESQRHSNLNRPQVSSGLNYPIAPDLERDTAWKSVKAKDLAVGDILRLEKDQRIPADVVILQVRHSDDNSSAVLDAQHETSELGGASSTDARRAAETRPCNLAKEQDAFIRTDQLDGETDWKLRIPPALSQSLSTEALRHLKIEVGPPERQIDAFTGLMKLEPMDQSSQRSSSALALSIDNTAWANTVLASNVIVYAAIIFTGRETRQALSTASSRSKTGLLESEINGLTKILCILTLALSAILVALRGIEGRQGQAWYVAVTRFLILFSTIVPISLRVNLDMGKTVYARFIEKDEGILGTIVRTSTIPEELGRIEYLLTDKTGTLTQNDMDLRKVHLGTVSFANDAMDEVRTIVQKGMAQPTSSGTGTCTSSSTLMTPKKTRHQASSIGRSQRDMSNRVRDLVMALALCHNVTPSPVGDKDQAQMAYQASSPDEIAIVKWTESMGLKLIHRDRASITLQAVENQEVVVHAEILESFPFTSASKRMGIILRFAETFKINGSGFDTPISGSEIWFFEKGADTVMRNIVASNDWLDEEASNMAREGLRTLIIGRKYMTQQEYDVFSQAYLQCTLSLQIRDEATARVISEHLERDLEFLGITGVEDKLQHDVKPSLELLRNAGIKIWMLTGDKVETARCVALSAKLIARNQYIHAITNLSDASDPRALADNTISILRAKVDSTALLIDGCSLQYLLDNFRDVFIDIAVLLPVVVACRCSPTQKADIANFIRKATRKRVACIGDGGNDVSMIQAADVGLGIVGKEGQQASMAADFSITTFHHLPKLLVWHGRNSYKRSAKLAQFVIHRGLIVSVCQTFYSIATELQPHALYRDWLLVGYATVYTMAPVFSLVLDKDLDEGLANLYPELYRELIQGRSLSYRSFFRWVAISVYQGAIIQGCSQLLVDRDSNRMISVSFTVIILNELIMVAIEIVTWHWIMLATILGTLGIYFGSIPFLAGYFDLAYVWSWAFTWRVVAIASLSLIPPYIVKILSRVLKPPSYRKIQGV